jgi:hypothetical protein
MENNKENKISLILQNFIDELSKGYDMTDEEKEDLEKLASEDTLKLYNQKNHK